MTHSAEERSEGASVVSQGDSKVPPKPNRHGWGTRHLVGGPDESPTPPKDGGMGHAPVARLSVVAQNIEAVFGVGRVSMGFHPSDVTNAGVGLITMPDVATTVAAAAGQRLIPAPALKRDSFSRIPELDGIRAIAIWMVMVMHAVIAFPYPKTINRFLYLVIGHGWLGVDLFFVLSGFLITGILLDAKGKSGYFKIFYGRRIFRIMPLYFAMVIIWSFFYRHYGSYFLLSSVFLANFAPLLHIRMPHGPSTLWSLAIEEQFYVVWPWLVLLLSRRRLVIAAASIVVLEPLIRAIHAYYGLDPNFIYNLTWCRCDGLATGALLAIWVRSSYFSERSNHRVIAYLLSALALLTLVGLPFGVMRGYTVAGTSLRYTQAYLFYAACFALTLTYQGSVWTSPLRWSFIRLSGALSYCLYLIHISVGQIYQATIGEKLPVTMPAVFLRAVAMITAAILLAMISKRFLEDPCLRLKDRLFPVRRT